MGWLFRPNESRKSLIKRLTEDRSWEHNGKKVTIKSLAHCFRGAPTHKGNLWCVHETVVADPTTGEEATDRFIVLYLLQCYAGDWGYKDVSETMGPYECNCPKSYLQLVPLDRYAGDEEWRERVAKYHEHVAERRRLRRKLNKNYI